MWSNVAAGNLIQQGPIRRWRADLPASGRSELAQQSIVRTGEFRGAADRHGPRGLPELAMTILKWALIFFLVSIVAGILGFTGISEASADIARFLFYVFVVIFLVLLILGLTIFRV
jgi:uncharacterized membrane protein YtjA (UPF0391 family)